MGGGWEERKLEAWQRLLEDLHIGYLDEDILDVLVEIFMRPGSYSKSSCSGRITVIDNLYPWAKEDTMTVYKKHSQVDPAEIIEIMGRPYRSRLWLSVQGPIYHVYTRSLEEAREILAAAREAGFKHSGVMTLGETPLVELRTGVRGDVLLADHATGYRLAPSQVEAAVRVANEILLKAKERNRRLLESLRRRRPQRLWEPAARYAEELGIPVKQPAPRSHGQH